MDDSPLPIPKKPAIPRRWWVLLIALGALSVMGFYTVTNPDLLTHSHLLDGTDVVGYALCHRITERSFTIAGRQMPLCARCTGMYLGVILTFVVLGLSGRGRWTELPPLPIMLILIGLVGLMGIDGINSYSHFFPNAPHLYEPQNWLRLLTGMGTGLTMGVFVFPALAQTIWQQQVRQPILRSWSELAGLLFLGFLLVLLIMSNQPLILYVLAIASAAGVLLILTCLNGIIGLVLFRRDGQANNWQQAAGPLVLSLVLALVQLGAISFIRFSLTGTMTGFPGL